MFIESAFAYPFVIGCAIFGIVWGFVNIFLISKTDMDDHSHLTGAKHGDNEGLKESLNPDHHHGSEDGAALLERMKHISRLIERGAITFLRQEYFFLSIFLFLFAILLIFTVDQEVGYKPYTTMAFIIGCITSITCGYIGMRVAVYTNVRTTKLCCEDIGKGFVVAYRGGQVLGFVLVGLAILILQILIIIYKACLIKDDDSKTQSELEGEVLQLFEMIAGYGLGGSTVALFGRVGGGIYTKAADVGSDLAGKVIQGLPEDDPSNPGVIADNVGDNVGDIAGMGSDLFGSLAESTCAAFVVGATSGDLLYTTDAMYFPLMLTASGIIVSFFTQFVACNIVKVKFDTVEQTVKWQLIISTVLMTGVVYPLTYVLPDHFAIPPTGSDSVATYNNYTILDEHSNETESRNVTIFSANLESATICTPINAYYCVMCGLWSGFIIGWITEIYTSSSYSPVQELAEACRMGAAPNIILGLALGYMSTIIPIICIAITIYVAYTFAGMYGIALAALGMLGCLPIALSIDGYGPISDNAGGIAEMAGLHPSVRRNTDKLDAAGNTTAAIGKGFAIGSACLVALALFGAFVTRARLTSVDLLQPLIFSGLLIGAMLPYAFSALTMAAVGNAATDMIAEIKRQFQNEDIRERRVEPDYDKCIQISTSASIRKMIAPGLLVIGSPFVVGILFGKEAVSGLLAGSIVSGVQIAISFSNSGGAWDNAKKFIEAGTNKSKSHIQEEDGTHYTFVKHSDAHKAAVVGDTVGDPLKDTSGPSINILIKLSAITSLVFGTFIREQGGILLSH